MELDLRIDLEVDLELDFEEVDLGVDLEVDLEIDLEVDLMNNFKMNEFKVIINVARSRIRTHICKLVQRPSSLLSFPLFIN